MGVLILGQPDQKEKVLYIKWSFIIHIGLLRVLLGLICS